MAAERTPSRRKQCIFRRTFQRFPFGKCERRCRSSSSSSYDVHNVDVPPSKSGEKWSSTDPSINTFSVHQGGLGEGMEQATSNKPQATTTTAAFNGGYEDSLVLEPVSIHHVSCLPISPHHLVHQHINSMQIHPDIDRPDPDSAYSSVSYREEQHQVVSPPSPSISSMETDVGVDPETGERAME